MRRCSKPRRPTSVERLARARLDLGARDALHAQPERHVAVHVAVREQRVVLEHQPEAAPVRRHAREVDAVPRHAPGGVGFQPGDRAQQRALAAAARSEDAHDLAVGDLEVDGGRRAVKSS